MERYKFSYTRSVGLGRTRAWSREFGRAAIYLISNRSLKPAIPLDIYTAGATIVLPIRMRGSRESGEPLSFRDSRLSLLVMRSSCNYKTCSLELPKPNYSVLIGSQFSAGSPYRLLRFRCPLRYAGQTNNPSKSRDFRSQNRIPFSA